MYAASRCGCSSDVHGTGVAVQITMREPRGGLIGTTPSTETSTTALKPAQRSKVTVEDKTDEQLDALQNGSAEATTKIALMVVAAEILELLAEPSFSASVVAQGGLLASARALEWDLHPDMNTACAMVLFKLASESPAYLQMVRSCRLKVTSAATRVLCSPHSSRCECEQALEAGSCDSLAQLTASEEAEEKAAASKALALLLAGVSRLPAAVPALGAKAAAAVAPGLPRPPSETGTECTAGGAPTRYQPGGGMPTASIFSLLQLVAMADGQESSLDIPAAMHALRLATEAADARQEVLACASPLPAASRRQVSVARTTVSA